MSTKTVITSFVAAALLASIGALAFSNKLSREKHTTYHVTGKVISIDREENTIKIRHDEIPGYMAAMIMPFNVRKPAILKQVQTGDAISFRFEVTETDSWISRLDVIEPRQDEPVEAALEIAGRIQTGETVPNISFINQNGELVQLHDFKGRAVLMTFIYTRCPLPTFCPLLASRFGELQERLSREFPGQFQLISLTLDPAFDTPEVLKSYALRNEADESSWSFLTGSAEAIDSAVAMFGVQREEAGGLINHDLRTALISPDGKLLHVWRSNAWTAYELQRSVRQALTGSIDVARK